MVEKEKPCHGITKKKKEQVRWNDLREQETSRRANKGYLLNGVVGEKELKKFTDRTGQKKGERSAQKKKKVYHLSYLQWPGEYRGRKGVVGQALPVQKYKRTSNQQTDGSEF